MLRFAQTMGKGPHRGRKLGNPGTRHSMPAIILCVHLYSARWGVNHTFTLCLICKHKRF